MFTITPNWASIRIPLILSDNRNLLFFPLAVCWSFGNHEVNQANPVEHTHKWPTSMTEEICQQL